MNKKLKYAALGLLSVTALFSCSNDKVVKLHFDDGDVFADTALPMHSCSSSYSWAMMQLTTVDITITYGKDTYTYYAEDWGVTDKSSAMYFHRTWTYTGTYTIEEQVYKMAKATTCVKTLEYGSSFADYASIWGPQGTTTDDATDLGKFYAADATFNGDEVTFVVYK